MSKLSNFFSSLIFWINLTVSLFEYISLLNLKKEFDIILVVKKVDVNWYKSAKLNDKLVIETCLKYAKNSSITLNQVAYKYDSNNHEHELLVSGVIQIVAINSQNKVRRMNTILNHKFFQ